MQILKWMGFEIFSQYLCFSSLLSLLSIDRWVLFCSSRWSQNANPKIDAVSRFLSTSLLLLPPLSSLYILVAPALLQQVVPECESKNGYVFKFSLTLLLLLLPVSSLYIYWWLLLCSSRWSQNANPKMDAFPRVLSISRLLLPPLSSFYKLMAPVSFQHA